MNYETIIREVFILVRDVIETGLGRVKKQQNHQDKSLGNFIARSVKEPSKLSIKK